jgi:hypothetical protein
MDDEGYVLLGEVANFRRVQNFNAKPSMILEAVLSSNKLEVMKPQEAFTDASAMMCNTKIRCVEDPFKWVSAREGMESLSSFSRDASPSPPVV